MEEESKPSTDIQLIQELTEKLPCQSKRGSRPDPGGNGTPVAGGTWSPLAEPWSVERQRSNFLDLFVFHSPETETEKGGHMPDENADSLLIQELQSKLATLAAHTTAANRLDLTPEEMEWLLEAVHFYQHFTARYQRVITISDEEYRYNEERGQRSNLTLHKLRHYINTASQGKVDVNRR